MNFCMYLYDFHLEQASTIFDLKEIDEKIKDEEVKKLMVRNYSV